MEYLTEHQIIYYQKWKNKKTFKEVLKNAQNLGYAEPGEPF